jgi:hypothetical protein
MPTFVDRRAYVPIMAGLPNLISLLRDNLMKPMRGAIARPSVVVARSMNKSGLESEVLALVSNRLGTNRLRARRVMDQLGDIVNGMKTMVVGMVIMMMMAVGRRGACG